MKKKIWYIVDIIFVIIIILMFIIGYTDSIIKGIHYAFITFFIYIFFKIFMNATIMNKIKTILYISMVIIILYIIKGFENNKFNSVEQKYIKDFGIVLIVILFLISFLKKHPIKKSNYKK